MLLKDFRESLLSFELMHFKKNLFVIPGVPKKVDNFVQVLNFEARYVNNLCLN